MERHRETVLESFYTQEEAAIDRIFKKYFNRIYYFALHICNAPAAAEDLTQEIFIKLWESSKTTRILSLESFLYTIAKRTAIDYMRKNINRELILSLSEEDRNLYWMQLDDGEDELEQKIEIEEKLSQIERAAEKMPKGRLEIFKLRWEEGLSIKEIAKRLDISLSTVNIQLRKAMDFLKDNTHIPTVELLLLFAFWEI